MTYLLLGAYLKLIIIPPASMLDLSSVKAFSSSFLRSQALALKTNRGSDSVRKAMGHVMIEINCSGPKRLTSISTNGLHGYMQSSQEISRFYANNKKDAKILTYEISQNDCRDLMAFDDFYRKQKRIEFSPFADPLEKLGGTGASYAVALMKIAHIDAEYELFLESFMGKSFYTAQGFIR